MEVVKLRGMVHLILTGIIFIMCWTILWYIDHTVWPFGAMSTNLLVGALFMAGLLFSWRGIANVRASEDLYLLALVRKMGGRITAAELAHRACKRLARITRFLEYKVQRGQAVMFSEGDEVTYIFDGFVDHTGKDLAFKL